LAAALQGSVTKAAPLVDELAALRNRYASASKGAA
jgi:hypothetical protein